MFSIALPMLKVRLFLKVVVDTSLFHDPICRMSGLYFYGNRKTVVFFRAVPKVMVAFAVSEEITAVLG
jgi:hypothetical protein